jgi:hypothetical protein
MFLLEVTFGTMGETCVYKQQLHIVILLSAVFSLENFCNKLFFLAAYPIKLAAWHMAAVIHQVLGETWVFCVTLNYILLYELYWFVRETAYDFFWWEHHYRYFFFYYAMAPPRARQCSWVHNQLIANEYVRFASTVNGPIVVHGSDNQFVSSLFSSL